MSIQPKAIPFLFAFIRVYSRLITPIYLLYEIHPLCYA